MILKKEQFASSFQERFSKVNAGQKIPDAWLLWIYDAYQQGYWKGRDDFSKEHDWYE